MKNQSTFSDVEYLNRKRVSKREEFLEAMNEIVPEYFVLCFNKKVTVENRRSR